MESAGSSKLGPGARINNARRETSPPNLSSISSYSSGVVLKQNAFPPTRTNSFIMRERELRDREQRELKERARKEQEKREKEDKEREKKRQEKEDEVKELEVTREQELQLVRKVQEEDGEKERREGDEASEERANKPKESENKQKDAKEKNAKEKRNGEEGEKAKTTTEKAKQDEQQQQEAGSKVRVEDEVQRSKSKEELSLSGSNLLSRSGEVRYRRNTADGSVQLANSSNANRKASGILNPAPNSAVESIEPQLDSNKNKNNGNTAVAPSAKSPTRISPPLASLALSTLEETNLIVKTTDADQENDKEPERQIHVSPNAGANAPKAPSQAGTHSPISVATASPILLHRGPPSSFHVENASRVDQNSNADVIREKRLLVASGGASSYTRSWKPKVTKERKLLRTRSEALFPTVTMVCHFTSSLYTSLTVISIN